MKIQLNALVLAVSASLLLSACGKNTSESVDRPTVKDSSQPTQPEKQPEVKPETKPETKPEKQPEETKPATGEKALSDVLKDGRFAGFSHSLDNVPGDKTKTLTEQIEAMEAVTVLVPTNDAMNKTAAILEKLERLKDTNNDNKVDAYDLAADPQLFASLLKYHVLTQNLDATTLMKKVNTNLPTLNGLPLVVTKEGDNYMIPSQAIQLANIEKSDTASQAKINTKDGKPEVNIKIKNGVVHVIDQALIPPTLTTDEVLQKLPDTQKFREFVKLVGGSDDGTIASIATDKKATSYTVLAPNNATINKKCVALNEPAKSLTGGKDIINANKECVLEPLANFGAAVNQYVPISNSVKSGTLFSAELKDVKGKFIHKNIVAKDGVVYVTDSFQ